MFRGISLLVALVASPVMAEGFVLAWNVPCAPAPDVNELLGPVEGQAAVTITGTADRWLLEVVFAAPVAGTRKVPASSCEEAVSAARLLLRLGSTGAGSFEEPPPAPIPPLVVAPAPPPPPAPLPIQLELTGAASIGSAPSVTPRFRVGAGLGVGDWLALISAGAGVPASYPAGTRRFEVHPTLGAELSGCFLPAWNRVRIGPCAALGVEWWRAQGLNVTNPRAGSDAWIGAGLDARVQVQLVSGLFAVARFGGRVAVRRPQVVFDDVGSVWIAPLFSGELAAGLGWVF